MRPAGLIGALTLLGAVACGEDAPAPQPIIRPADPPPETITLPPTASAGRSTENVRMWVLVTASTVRVGRGPLPAPSGDGVIGAPLPGEVVTLEEIAPWAARNLEPGGGGGTGTRRDESAEGRTAPAREPGPDRPPPEALMKAVAAMDFGVLTALVLVLADASVPMRRVGEAVRAAAEEPIVVCPNVGAWRDGRIVAVEVDCQDEALGAAPELTLGRFLTGADTAAP